jgi:hypothetical protein
MERHPSPVARGRRWVHEREAFRAARCRRHAPLDRRAPPFTGKQKPVNFPVSSQPTNGRNMYATPALFFGRPWLVADLALSVAGRRSGPHGDDEEAPAAAEGRPQAVTVSMCNDDQTSAQDARRRRAPCSTL